MEIMLHMERLLAEKYYHYPELGEPLRDLMSKWDSLVCPVAPVQHPRIGEIRQIDPSLAARFDRALIHSQIAYDEQKIAYDKMLVVLNSQLIGLMRDLNAFLDSEAEEESISLGVASPNCGSSVSASDVKGKTQQQLSSSNHIVPLAVDQAISVVSLSQPVAFQPIATSPTAGESDPNAVHFGVADIACVASGRRATEPEVFVVEEQVAAPSVAEGRRVTPLAVQLKELNVSSSCVVLDSSVPTRQPSSTADLACAELPVHQEQVALDQPSAQVGVVAHLRQDAVASAHQHHQHQERVVHRADHARVSAVTSPLKPQQHPVPFSQPGVQSGVSIASNASQVFISGSSQQESTTAVNSFLSAASVGPRQVVTQDDQQVVPALIAEPIRSRGAQQASVVPRGRRAAQPSAVTVMEQPVSDPTAAVTLRAKELWSARSASVASESVPSVSACEQNQQQTQGAARHVHSVCCTHPALVAAQDGQTVAVQSGGVSVQVLVAEQSRVAQQQSDGSTKQCAVQRSHQQPIAQQAVVSKEISRAVTRVPARQVHSTISSVEQQQQQQQQHVIVSPHVEEIEVVASSAEIETTASSSRVEKSVVLRDEELMTAAYAFEFVSENESLSCGEQQPQFRAHESGGRRAAMEPTVSPSVVTIVSDSLSYAASALELPSVAVSSTVVMSSMDTQLSSEVRAGDSLRDAGVYEHRSVSADIISTGSESEAINSRSKPRFFSAGVESGTEGAECPVLGDRDGAAVVQSPSLPAASSASPSADSECVASSAVPLDRAAAVTSILSVGVATDTGAPTSTAVRGREAVVVADRPSAEQRDSEQSVDAHHVASQSGVRDQPVDPSTAQRSASPVSIRSGLSLGVGVATFDSGAWIRTAAADPLHSPVDAPAVLPITRVGVETQSGAWSPAADPSPPPAVSDPAESTKPSSSSLGENSSESGDTSVSVTGSDQQQRVIADQQSESDEDFGAAAPQQCTSQMTTSSSEVSLSTVIEISQQSVASVVSGQISTCKSAAGRQLKRAKQSGFGMEIIKQSRSVFGARPPPQPPPPTRCSPLQAAA